MKNKLSISLDLRIVCILLVAVILAMFAFWRPWQANDTGRKITVTGTGKVTAQPDSYQFGPSFTVSNSDRQTATNQLNAKLNEVTSKLKSLGVQDKDIQVQSSSYQETPYSPSGPTTTAQKVYSTVSIKVESKELAQKVQDYLATTGAEGQLTSTPSFSDTKQKELTNQARDKAIADAKAQAQKTADNLGLKLGKVIELSDNEEPDYRIMNGTNLSVAQDSAKPASVSTPIYSGQQDITFSVKAVFELK